MRYREYGKTGIKLSALGFGCMRFPMENNHVKEEKSIDMLHSAMDSGINYFDSAVMYCNDESEGVLGKAVKGRREELYVSTKNHYKGRSPDKWREFLNQSLERLGIDYIDFYHFHDLSYKNYSEDMLPYGVMAEAKKAKEQGLIKHICFSSHDNPENIIKLIDTGEFAGMLVQYNLLDRSNEKAIAHANDNGLGVCIMGPVGGGRLVPPSEKIKDMISGDVKSTPELAIRFVLSNLNVTVALSGMNSAEAVKENAETVSRSEPLTEEERRNILDSIEENKKLENLYCTGCGYCMPCPNGVDIPGNFSAMNMLKVWGLKKVAEKRYSALARKKGDDGKSAPAWAEACVECGECMSKCPQNIAIIEQLKEVKEKLSA